MNGREIIRIAYTQHTTANPYVVWLSNHVCTVFQIEPGSKTWFRFGSERILVTCEVKLDDTYGMLSIPKELQQNHHLPAETEAYTISYSSEKNEISIGPLIAMFVEKRDNAQNPFGSITEFAYELDQFCKQNRSAFYLFSIEDVASDGIEGYRFKNHELIKEVFPFPNVIYNRISNRTLERSESYVQFFNDCLDLGIPYFNDRFLSKRDIFSLLVEQDSLAGHLPRTLTVMDPEEIGTLMDTFSILFLKPIHGSEGRGILKISKRADGQFQLEASKALDPPLPLLNKEGVLHFIEQYVPGEQYILQQGIDLITHSEGNVDFRILCNRNEYGIWCITSSTARVGIKEHIVTNVSKGAQIRPIKEILETRFSKQMAQYIRTILYDLAIETSRCIHQKADGLFGEFGIDFGVDCDGHVWLLEVNTKPSKHTWMTNNPTEIRPSAKGVFLFANYLYTTSSPDR